MIKLGACTKVIVNKTPLVYLMSQVMSGALPPLLINDGQVLGVENKKKEGALSSVDLKAGSF